jgi:hypothetical protein
MEATLATGFLSLEAASQVASRVHPVGAMLAAGLLRQQTLRGFWRAEDMETIIAVTSSGPGASNAAGFARLVILIALGD